jgi:hypothetical protein
MPSESPVIVRIIADHARAIDALPSTPVDSLDAVTLRANYEGAVNLTCALNTSENLCHGSFLHSTANEYLYD